MKRSTRRFKTGFRYLLFTAVAACAFASANAKTCTWTGAGSDGNASTAENWSDNAAPETGDDIVLDATGADKPMTWDLWEVSPGSWTQKADYTETVTISTTFDESQHPVFAVSGDVAINGGSWTHARSPNPPANKKGDGTYRLKVNVGGSFTLGANAKVDLVGKGLGAGQGFMDGGGTRGGSYGGRGKSNNSPCYGSVKHPYHVAAGGSANYGGGCLMLTVAGAATIDGEVVADGGVGTGNTELYYAAAGGTVAITAATISGSGVISANGGNVLQYLYAMAGGGRISLIQTAAGSTYATLPANVTAYGSFEENQTTHEIKQPKDIWSGAGTIYYEVPEDNQRGKLILKNRFAVPFSYDQLYATEFNAYMDQDLDFHEIEISHGAAMHIMEAGIIDVKNTPITGDGAGQLIVGVDLDLGEDWTWRNVSVHPLNGANIYGSKSTVFTSEVVYTGSSHAPGDLTLAAGAKVTHPYGVKYLVDLTVDGNLEIAEGAMVDVTMKGGDNATGCPRTQYFSGSGHGGRGGVWPGQSDTTTPCYGDVREPVTSGSKGSHNGTGVREPGGVAKLTVGGTLTLDGIVASVGCGGAHQAASAGSLQIIAGQLVGHGIVSAVGGYSEQGAAGGGGRIAVTLTGAESTMDDFDGKVIAFGRGTDKSIGYYPTNVLSSVDTHSGAGTIYIREKDAALNAGTLVVSQCRTEGRVLADGYTEICSGVTGLEYGAIEVKEMGVLKLNDEVSIKSSGWSVAEGSDLVCAAATTQTIKGDGEGNAYLSGNLNFTTLIIESSVKTLYVEPDSEISVAKAINAVGTDADHRIKIRSTTDGGVFYLTVDPAASQELAFIDVKDCDASHGAQVFASNSVSDNCENWKCESIDPGELNEWTGAADAAWGNAANWSRERAPAATDLVVIRGDAVRMPETPSTELILSNLTIQAGAKLVSSGKSITVTGGFSNRGDIVFVGSEPLTLTGGGEWLFAAADSYPNLVFAVGSCGTVKGVLNASQLTVGGGAAIRFAQGAAVTVTVLSADGTDAAIAFSPEQVGGTYGFTVSGYADVKGVQVGGADSSAGMTVYATASEATAANVVNWKFEDTRKFWTGAVSGDPSVAENWQGGEVPTEADDVVVMSPTKALTVGAEGFKVKSLTVMDGAVVFSKPAEIVSALVALDGATVTVDAPLRAGSVALLGTSAMTHTANADAELYGIDIVTTGDFFIDSAAKIDVTGKGYASTQGLQGGLYGGAFAPACGGIGQQGGAEADMNVYGSVLCPTNCGASSDYGSGGGKVKLTVGGTFTVNGSVEARGTATVLSCSAAGGSVWITASRMSGTGGIHARGGDCQEWGGSGGRISLMLTEKGADFSGMAKATVEAYRNISASTKLPSGVQCGTIYRQTGDEEFGCGTVYIENDPLYAGTGCGTALPSKMLCKPNELKNAKLVIGHGAGVILRDNLTVRDIEFLDDSGRLDLNAEGYVLTVRSPWHAYPKSQVSNAGEWTDGKKPGYENIKWGMPGMAIMVR